MFSTKIHETTTTGLVNKVWTCQQEVKYSNGINLHTFLFGLIQPHVLVLHLRSQGQNCNYIASKWLTSFVENYNTTKSSKS